MKKLNELSKEELKQVYDNNSKLKSDIFDDYVETVDFWISDYLECFKRNSINYELDVSGYYNYITVKDYKEFTSGLKQCQRDYCLLDDVYNGKIAYVESLMDRLDNLDFNTFNYDINVERLTDRIEDIIKELSDALYQRIKLEYDSCYDYNNLLDYFLEFYLDERMEKDDFYVDDDYVLFEHIEYEKSYV